MPILGLTMISILLLLFSMQTTAYAITFNDLDPKLQSFDVQKSIDPSGVNIGRIILYSIVIVIVILTRFRWTRHGRKITKTRLIIESIFFLVIGSIVVFDSFYNVGVPILYLIPFLLLFFGLQHISYLHSNRLMSFWKESKSKSIYVKGGSHIYLAYVVGTASRIIISILFIGSLFSPSRRGIIYADESTTLLATILTNLLLMASLGLLIGINRRILVRYNSIMEGRETISER